MGRHFSSFYKDKTDQFSAVIPYLTAGLNSNEKCVYVYEESDPDEISYLLFRSGVDADSFIKKGQLAFLPKEQTYVYEGFFNVQRTLDTIQEAHYQALISGFTGLRGFGEMSWALQGFPNSESLIEYEYRLNELFDSLKLSAICQYNETLFPEDILLGAIYTHPEVIFHGQAHKNPYYKKPETAKSRAEFPSYKQIKADIINS